MPLAEAVGAICVQRFDDSRNSAIHTTYRISLRSSSLQEPRYPLLRVVLCLDYNSSGTTGRRSTKRCFLLSQFWRCCIAQWVVVGQLAPEKEEGPRHAPRPPPGTRCTGEGETVGCYPASRATADQNRARAAGERAPQPPHPSTPLHLRRRRSK